MEAAVEEKAKQQDSAVVVEPATAGAAEAPVENKGRASSETPAAEDNKTSVSSVDYPQAQASIDKGPKGSLDVLLDVNVPMTVVIGSAQVAVRRLLQLGEGSVIKLDRLVEEPVDVFLKGSLFAKADVVVVDDKFAVRIKQILTPGGEQKEKSDAGS